MIASAEPPPFPVSDSSVLAIDLRSLRVDYGDFIAVHDLTLQVPKGEVFGLVGPNGAGKTSTFRVVSTLMQPTYGTVILDGVDVFEDLEYARRIIGYMPDLAPVPGDLKVGEFLEFHAAAYGIGNRAERLERVARCLEEVAMTSERDKWCKELSRGQTQRVVLAKTLLHRPRVMILDEPASGLDPLARRDLRLTLRRIAETGTTIFISSHILSELAEMCTSMCLMNKGRLLAAGTADEIRRQLGGDQRQLTATFLGNASTALAWLQAQEGVEDAQRRGEQVAFRFLGTPDAQADLIEAIVREGLRLRSIDEQRSSIEDILVEVAESNRRPAPPQGPPAQP